MPEPEQSIDELLSELDESALRGIVRSALDRHADVEREVRLVAARGSGDLGQVRAEVDRGLRTRRFLDYRASMAWAQEARPIVSELAALSESAPSGELVELLQRAVGHVVKVLLRGDDSSGAIGDVARELLDLHAATCDALVADPVKLAKWMVRFRFVDQDFFEADPVRYRVALGERGLAQYRRAVMSSETPDAFAARYARERLAVLDGDVEAIVRLFGGDLRSPHQFVGIAEAMLEIGQEDEVLAWGAVSRRRPDGRPPSSTTWPARSTRGGATALRCWRCGAGSTRWRRRSRPTRSCAPRQSPSAHGNSSAMRAGRLCGGSTGARSSRPC